MRYTPTEWEREGVRLANLHNAILWEIGDWMNDGATSMGRGACKRIMLSPTWRGVKYKTAIVYAHTARKFPQWLRYLNLEPSFYMEAANGLSVEQAVPLLQKALEENWSVNQLRGEVSRIKHRRPIVGGDVYHDIADVISRGQTYRAVLIDPPWDIETTPGRRHSSKSRYTSLTNEQIKELPIEQIADPRAFLFLWCPSSLFYAASDILKSWNLKYVEDMVWKKTGIGTGYYFRMAHEHLLLGRAPKAPRHFIDRSIPSVLEAKRGEHSEKPIEVYSIIERAVPGPFIELFARRRWQGWSQYGNQLSPAEQEPNIPEVGSDSSPEFAVNDNLPQIVDGSLADD